MDQAEFHSQVKTFESAQAYEKISRLLNWQSGPSLKILEGGCGTGEVCKYLASLGHQVFGMDVQKPEKAGGWQFIDCDINKPWPVQQQSFDVVICTDVAEHVYDPAQILKQAKAALKPNGRLIFGVPNHFDLRQRLRMLFGRGIVHWDAVKYGETPWLYSHIRFLTLPQLEEMFGQEGFFIETRQLNFNGAGIVPVRLTPKFLRLFLLSFWPNLFSGKFIFVIKPGISQDVKSRQIYLPQTPPGM